MSKSLWPSVWFDVSYSVVDEGVCDVLCTMKSLIFFISGGIVFILRRNLFNCSQDVSSLLSDNDNKWFRVSGWWQYGNLDGVLSIGFIICIFTDIGYEKVFLVTSSGSNCFSNLVIILFWCNTNEFLLMFNFTSYIFHHRVIDPYSIFVKNIFTSFKMSLCSMMINI